MLILRVGVESGRYFHTLHNISLELILRVGVESRMRVGKLYDKGWGKDENWDAVSVRVAILLQV